MLSMTLKRLRRNCGFSQQQVADTLKIDRSTYAYYEIGKTKPDVHTIIKLTKIFNVPYEEILKEEETSGYIFSDYTSDHDISKKCDISQIKEKVYELSKDEKSLLCFFRVMMKEEQQKLLENLSKKSKDHENEKE